MAITAYCAVEEPLRMSNKLMGSARPPPPPEVATNLDPLARALSFRESVLGEPGQVKRCFVCTAKALTLTPDDPNLALLTRIFYDSNTLSRHFVSVHLSAWEPGAMDRCPVCVPVVELLDKMHLQNHAETFHGIKSHLPKRTS